MTAWQQQCSSLTKHVSHEGLHLLRCGRHTARQANVTFKPKATCGSGFGVTICIAVLQYIADLVLRASMTGVKRSLSSAAMWEAHLRDVLTRACES